MNGIQLIMVVAVIGFCLFILYVVIFDDKDAIPNKEKRDSDLRKINKIDYKKSLYEPRLLLTAAGFIITNLFINEKIYGWEGVLGAVVVGIIYSLFTIEDNSQKKLNHNSESISNSSETIDIPDQIKKLSDLKDQGILTEEEFQNKKKDLLDKM